MRQTDGDVSQHVLDRIDELARRTRRDRARAIRDGARPWTHAGVGAEADMDPVAARQLRRHPQSKAFERADARQHPAEACGFAHLLRRIRQHEPLPADQVDALGPPHREHLVRFPARVEQHAAMHPPAVLPDAGRECVQRLSHGSTVPPFRSQAPPRIRHLGTKTRDPSPVNALSPPRHPQRSARATVAEGLNIRRGSDENARTARSSANRETAGACTLASSSGAFVEVPSQRTAHAASGVRPVRTRDAPAECA